MLVDGISLVEGSAVTNLVVPTGTAFPSLADAGELFFKTDEGKLYVYSGSLWTAAGVDFDTLHVKEAVRVATTVNITLGGTQTIDGVSVLAGDRVLVKNQSTASQNGIYVASAGGWTRSTDFDGSPSTEVQSGDFFFVTEGTENSDTGWVVSTNGTIQVGTTAINFAQFSGATAMAAGDNMQLQFNNAGAFAGTAQMYYNGTNTLTVGAVDSTFTITSAGTTIGGQIPGAVRIMGGQQNISSYPGGDVIVQGGPGANLNTTGGIVYLQGGVGIYGGEVRIRTATDGSNQVERLRFTNAGGWGLGGANYGTAGQVLTSAGNAPPTWTTPLSVVDAGDLTGTTLAANVVTSSLTSVGTLGSLNVTGTTTSGSFSGPLTGNASTATALQTSRTINGVSFDGTANITVTAAAGTLTGTTLAANVVTSSLTSVGTLGSLAVTGGVTAATFTGALVGNASTASAAPAGTLTGTTLASNVVASSLTSVGTLTSLGTSGNVGIGTAAGTARLQVYSGSTPSNGIVSIFRNPGNDTGAQIQLTSTGVADWAIGIPSGTSAFSFFVNRSFGGGAGTEVLRVSSTGAIGLGGTSFGTAGQMLVSAGSAVPTWTSSIPSLTVTGTIVVPTPTAADHAATKSYVDNAAAGVNSHAAVRAATTTNIVTLSGLLSVDDVSLVAGNRVLVKDQSTASQNGVYIVAAGAWTRATDFDGSPTNEVTAGDLMFVSEGTTNANTSWILITEGTITVGTTPLAFTVFSRAADILGGAGLTKSGNVINVGTASAARIVVNTDNIDLATVGTAGTYKSVTTDAYGRVTAGTNPTTLAGYGITDALSTSGGTLTGPLTLGTTAQIGVTTTAVTTTTTTVIDSVSGSAFRTVKYLVEVIDSAAVHCVEILVTHRSGTVYKTEYAEITSSGAALGTFDAVVGANLELTFTATAATAKTVKVVRTAISV